MVPEQHKLWGDNILGSARTLGNTGGTSALPALMTQLSMCQKFPFCMDSTLSLNWKQLYSISSSKIPEDLFRRKNSMLSLFAFLLFQIYKWIRLDKYFGRHAMKGKAKRSKNWKQNSRMKSALVPQQGFYDHLHKKRNLKRKEVPATCISRSLSQTAQKQLKISSEYLHRYTEYLHRYIDLHRSMEYLRR